MNDVRDPGGRIGPYLEGGLPDLRNLDVIFSEIEDGDIIIILSDGVHDNVDAQWCGKLPSDAQINAQDNNWNNVTNDEETCQMRNQWTKKFLTSLIHGQSQIPPIVTAAIVTDRFIQHTQAITKNSRSFMENHPSKKVPEDKILYPGKMDHATCVAFKVDING